MNRVKKLIFIFLTAAVVILLQSAVANSAESITIQEDELAQESVLPKFDKNEATKNRNIITEKKIEFGAYYGWNILEPIMNQGKFGLNVGYHLSEMSALSLNYASWQNGLNTQYTDALLSSSSLDFSRTPKLKYSIYGHYEWKVFYGKISLTKLGVVNLSTYPIVGVGTTAYEHKSYFGFDLGIGQKFYFTKALALRADFKLQYSQKPSPFLSGKMRPTDPTPAPNDFKEIWDLATMLEIGMSFIF